MSTEMAMKTAVNWYEVYSPNVGSAVEFYKNVFGWESQGHPMGEMTYHRFKSGDTMFGGVMDLSDPTKPKLIGYYNTWDPQADYTSSGFFEGAVGLDVDQSRKLVFVADSPRGLLILHDDTP